MTTTNDLASHSRRFIELLDSQDWTALESHVATDVRAHVGSMELDKPAWLAMGKMFYAAFPDAHHAVERQITQDECCVTIASWRGTHRGDFMGLPATGRTIEMALILVDRYRGGLVIEHWGQFDSAGLMQQLTS